MKVMKFLAVGAAMAFACAVNATVIDFEDLVGQAEVPDGYGGVADWGDWWHYDFDQFPYSPHSGVQRIYNVGDGHFTFEDEVIFQGAWFAGYGSSGGYSPISFGLYLDGDLVHMSDSIDLLADGVSTWLDSGYGGFIDMVKVDASHGFYVMDDVTFVPAPGAFALLGMGLVGLTRRRR